MSAYMDDVRVRNASIRRMLVTVPFLIITFVSLLPLGMYGINWLRGQWVWHKTEAVITMVPSEESVYYMYSRDDVPYSGSLVRPKLLFFIPYGDMFEVDDEISIAYKVDDPAQHVVFVKQECNMLTWVIIFGVSIVLYFILDHLMKTSSGVRLTG